MHTYSDLLISSIKDYLGGKINRNELYTKALNIKNSIFSENELIMIENFSVYPFVFEIAISPSEHEAPDDNTLTNFLEVLEDRKSFQRCCYLRVPQGIFKKSISDIKFIVKGYGIKGKMEDEDLDKIHEWVSEIENHSVKTLVDLIYSNIIHLLSSLPFAQQNEINANSLYIDTEQINVNEILQKINNLIKYYESEKDFFITTYYQEGGYMISILV